MLDVHRLVFDTEKKKDKGDVYMKPEIIEVLAKILDSDDTTVGGGAASALSGAMAAGMIAMVAKLSRKNPVNFTQEQYDAIAQECDALVEKLQQGSVNDQLAYGRIVEAFKLPKHTDEEKAVRSAAVQAAAIKAAEVPRDNGRLNVRVYELGTMMKGNSNPACNSDLMSALYLSKGGIKDCVLNIQANLGLIKDENIKTALKEDMLDLLLQVI